MKEMAQTGRGRNQVQGSLSLDNERPECDTTLVKKMHLEKNMRAWVKFMEDNNIPHDHYIKKIEEKHFPKELRDRLKVQWEEVPCNRFEVRVSQSAFPHGSTGPVPLSIKRRTIFPCYVAMDETHDRSEVSAGPTWEELSAAHRDHTALPRTPSGLPYLFGKMIYRHPASVSLDSQNPVSDALMGRRRYTDTDVQLFSRRPYLRLFEEHSG